MNSTGECGIAPADTCQYYLLARKKRVISLRHVCTDICILNAHAILTNGILSIDTGINLRARRLGSYDTNAI
jgi:hypothetical protein